MLSGGASCPFQSAPTTKGWRGSPPANTTSTSSFTSGTNQMPRLLPAISVASRAHASYFDPPPSGDHGSDTFTPPRPPAVGRPGERHLPPPLPVGVLDVGHQGGVGAVEQPAPAVGDARLGHVEQEGVGDHAGLPSAGRSAVKALRKPYAWSKVWRTRVT